MNDKTKILTYIENLLNVPLCAAQKSPDTELYEFIFGEPIINQTPKNEKKNETYVLHVVCEFDIIFRKEKRIKHFDSNTDHKEFHKCVELCINKLIHRVAINETNQLWLDFGDIWVVLIPLENGEEAWRFFELRNGPHLVASNLELGF